MHRAAPLHALLKKVPQDESLGRKAERNRTIQWCKEAQGDFEDIKRALTSAPILAHPQFNSEEPYHSGRGLLPGPWCHRGGLELGPIREGKSDCLSSRKLLDQERNYPPNKGELRAIIFFIIQIRYFKQFRKFILRTDHKALKWLKSLQEPRGMVLRWLDILSNYQFKVVYRAGTSQANADALSRAAHTLWPTEEEQRILASNKCMMNALVAVLSRAKGPNATTDRTGDRPRGG